MILLNGGYGLFSESSNELLSFAVVNDHLATGILNTAKHARGKHYGETVIKYLCKKIAEDFDLHPTSYISIEKTPSMNLYKKLGFQKIGGCNWIVVDKK